MPKTLQEIGFIRSAAAYRPETPRQGVWSNRTAILELVDDPRFGDALHELETVDRLWLIWGFHLAEHWKPLVRPPQGADHRKIGVFATRSPHRPNQLGLSAVKLVRIEGFKLHLAEVDLLDGTPVYDLKPYVAESDAFPDAKVGWRKQALPSRKLIVTSEAEAQLNAIERLGGPNLREIARVQLTTRELDPRFQRLTPGRTPNEWILAFRTWRCRFLIDGELVLLREIFSGYSAEQLQDPADPYGDKALHRTLILAGTCKSNEDMVY